MNKDQIDSVVRSVLKIAGAIAVAHGASAYAGIINSEDVTGLASLVVGLLLSYQWHAPAPEQPSSAALNSGSAAPMPAVISARIPTSAAAPRATDQVNTLAGLPPIASPAQPESQAPSQSPQ